MEAALRLPETLTEFLDMFGEEIKNKVAMKFKALHDPALHKNPYEGKMGNLLRPPIKGQKDPIIATVKALSKHSTAFLVGEMGTGKTFMGASAAYLLLPERSRTIVLCPGHLVDKWGREIKKTIPNAIIKDLNRRGLDLLFKLKKRPKPEGREFWIIGKEQAKLHYRKKASFTKRLGQYSCPECGTVLENLPNVRGKKPTCVNEECGCQLWSADRHGIKRFAKAEFIKKFLPKNTFDLLIADEVHQFKSGTSAQGQAYAYLTGQAKYTLNLTGTLMGGYSTNLFYLFWRSDPKAMQIISNYRSPMDFAQRYGVIERVQKEQKEANSSSIGRNKRIVRVSEKPGISPTIFTDFLLERCVFVSLSDIADELPPLNEIIEDIDMDHDQYHQYKQLEDDLLEACRKALRGGDKSLLGVMIQSLLAYPDGCRKGEVAQHPHRLDEITGEPLVLATAEALNIPMLPKERRLLEIVKAERLKGRNTLVYLEHTGTRDLIPDLKERLEKDGNRVLVLRSTTVPAAKREAWIFKKMEKGDYNVLILNPRLVETGLDLIMFPTVVFDQTGYSTFTLRQSSRRSWRIGQDKPVTVYYLSYKQTVQETALSLMADKLQVALAVEGNLSDGGLTAIAEGEASVLVAVAKTLLGEKEKTGPAKEIFKKLALKEASINERLDGKKITSNNDTHRRLIGIVTRDSQNDFAVAVLGQEVIRFQKGLIFYGGRAVGKYAKNGVGYILVKRNINGCETTFTKYIQLSPSSKADSYDLFELNPAIATQQKAA